MILLVLIVFILAGLVSARAGVERDREPVYLSRHHTSMMNGVFIWLVFLRHFSQYHPAVGGVDAWLLEHDCLGQLIVAPFFFFSGWGIMSSLQKKGKVYVRQLVQSRFLGLWVKFAIAVLLFALLQWCLGVVYPWQQVLISLIGWVSVGNSNWFVFMTLLLYLMVAVVFFTTPPQKPWLGIGAMVLLVGGVVYVFGMLKPSYWYNTLLCFPAGMMWLLLCKMSSDKTLRRGWLASLVCVPAGWWLHMHGGDLVKELPLLSFWCGSMLDNAGAVLFALGVALLTGSISLAAPRLSVCGRVLAWCGGPALFYLYIYQRIPMLVGSHYELHTSMPEFYAAACVIVTVLIAFSLVRIAGKSSSVSQPGKDGRKLRFF